MIYLYDSIAFADIILKSTKAHLLSCVFSGTDSFLN